MNKQDLINAVAEEAGLSKADAKRAIDSVFASIVRSLKRGDTVSLVGFGTFAVSKRVARVGRNPMTGRSIKIESARRPVLRASEQLREAVGGETDDPGPSITRRSKRRR